MEKLKTLLEDFSTIKEYYFWIDYYNRLEAKESIKIYNEKLEKIYIKYGIKNYNSMIKLIEHEFYRSRIYADCDLVKNIIFSIHLDKKVIDYDDNVFKEIYIYIIDNHLYNPNWNIGVSSEPLYVLIPHIPELFGTNLNFYRNGQIDWKILNNGTDSFMSFVYQYLECDDNKYKKYYLEILKSALSSCDIDSTLRYKTEHKKVCYQVESIKKQLSLINDMTLNNLFNNRMTKDFYNELLQQTDENIKSKKIHKGKSN